MGKKPFSSFFPSLKGLFLGSSWTLFSAVFISFFLIYPLISTFISSFFEPSLATPSGPRFIGLDNYIYAIFQDSTFQKAARLQAALLVFGVGGEVLFGLAIALLLNKSLRGRGVVKTILVIPFLMSNVTVALIWQWMLNSEFGIVNEALQSLFGIRISFLHPAVVGNTIILIWIWSKTPWDALVLLAGLSTIPESLYDAAKTDGASVWQMLRKITLPMLFPILLVNILFRLIVALRPFGLVFAITGLGSTVHVLSTWAYTMFYIFGRPNLASAMICIIALLAICINVAVSLVRKKVIKQRVR